MAAITDPTTETDASIIREGKYLRILVIRNDAFAAMKRVTGFRPLVFRGQYTERTLDCGGKILRYA